MPGRGDYLSTDALFCPRKPLHFGCFISPLAKMEGFARRMGAVAESGVRCGLFGRGRSATAGHAAVVVDARRRCGARERHGWLAGVGVRALRGTGSPWLARERCGTRGRHGWRARLSWLAAAEQRPAPSPIFQKISMARKNFS